jgi:hypothetical protein
MEPLALCLDEAKTFRKAGCSSCGGGKTDVVVTVVVMRLNMERRADCPTGVDMGLGGGVMAVGEERRGFRGGMGMGGSACFVFS